MTRRIILATAAATFSFGSVAQAVGELHPDGDPLAYWGFPQNFRDLTLVAGTIGDYAAMVMQVAGEDPIAAKYIPYNSGDKAIAALRTGEVAVLGTGFSEAVNLANAGGIKIIGVTTLERVDTYPNAATMAEQRIDTEVRELAGLSNRLPST